MSVSIVSARLPTGDTPVCSVTLEPYVLIKRGETTVTADDIPEEGSTEPGLQLRSKWYRTSIPRGGAVCSVHPEKEATVQCAVCLRCKVAVHLSYHCTAECFKRSWPQHLEYHRQAHANGECCTCFFQQMCGCRGTKCEHCALCCITCAAQQTGLASQPYCLRHINSTARSLQVMLIVSGHKDQHSFLALRDTCTGVAHLSAEACCQVLLPVLVAEYKIFICLDAYRPGEWPGHPQQAQQHNERWRGNMG